MQKRLLGYFSKKTSQASSPKHLSNLSFYLPNLTTLTLGCLKIKDLELISLNLSRATNLQGLEIDGNQLTERGVQSLACLTQLRYLKIYLTSYSSMWFENFSKLNLEMLDFVSNSCFEVVQLSYLSQMSGLTSLRISGVVILDEQIQYLSRITALQGLSLRGSSRSEITDVAAHYINNLTALTFLDLACSSITDAALFFLSSLTALKSLFLSETRITDVGLAALNTFLLLDTLNVKKCHSITEEGVSQLNRLPHLTHVFWNGGYIHLKKAEDVNVVSYEKF